MLLVTGATGFVGQDLQQELCTRGTAFRAASRSNRHGYSPVGDINGATDWSAALSGIEIVIHLAATNQNVVAGSGEDRALLRTVNVEGTVNLARQAAASGVRRFVFLSTIKVHGERTAEGRPFRQGDVPNPLSGYAVSKLEAERSLIELSGSSGMEIVIIRAPLVYGRDVGGSFRALTKLVKSGVPLPLGSIRNRRSMVYVENLSDLILTAALHPAAAGQILLAGEDEAVSTPELVRRLAAATGCPARLLPCPTLALRSLAAIAGKAELASRLTDWLEVDITPTRTLLDWTPPFDMGQALKRCF